MVPTTGGDPTVIPDQGSQTEPVVGSVTPMDIDHPSKDAKKSKPLKRNAPTQVRLNTEGLNGIYADAIVKIQRILRKKGYLYGNDDLPDLVKQINTLLRQGGQAIQVNIQHDGKIQVSPIKEPIASYLLTSAASSSTGTGGAKSGNRNDKRSTSATAKLQLHRRNYRKHFAHKSEYDSFEATLSSSDQDDDFSGFAPREGDNATRLTIKKLLKFPKSQKPTPKKINKVADRHFSNRRREDGLGVLGELSMSEANIDKNKFNQNTEKNGNGADGEKICLGENDISEHYDFGDFIDPEKLISQAEQSDSDDDNGDSKEIAPPSEDANKALVRAAKNEEPEFVSCYEIRNRQTVRKDSEDFFQASFSFEDRKFLTTYHVSKDTLTKICAVLRDNFNGITDDHYQTPLEKQIGISIYAMATGNSYSDIATLFQVSINAVKTYMRYFLDSFLEKFEKALIYVPVDDQQFNDIRNGFHKMSNIPPSCVGVFTHCDLTHESDNLDDLNQDCPDSTKGQGSKNQRKIFLSAWVDDKLQFRHVEINPNVMAMVNTIDLAGKITAMEPFCVDNYRMPCFLATTLSPYKPFRSWLMQPYVNAMTIKQQDFNTSMNIVVKTGKDAVYQLLGRWHILINNRHVDRKTFRKIIMCCCCLHNLMRQMDEPYFKPWEKYLESKKIHKIAKRTTGCGTSVIQFNEAYAVRETLAEIVTKFVR